MATQTKAFVDILASAAAIAAAGQEMIAQRIETAVDALIATVLTVDDVQEALAKARR